MKALDTLTWANNMMVWAMIRGEGTSLQSYAGNQHNLIHHPAATE
jgi:hypothetical protein